MTSRAVPKSHHCGKAEFLLWMEQRLVVSRERWAFAQEKETTEWKVYGDRMKDKRFVEQMKRDRTKLLNLALKIGRRFVIDPDVIFCINAFDHMAHLDEIAKRMGMALVSNGSLAIDLNSRFFRKMSMSNMVYNNGFVQDYAPRTG